MLNSTNSSYYKNKRGKRKVKGKMNKVTKMKDGILDEWEKKIVLIRYYLCFPFLLICTFIIFLILHFWNCFY